MGGLSGLYNFQTEDSSDDMGELEGLGCARVC
jgi:hypothetical protein